MPCDIPAIGFEFLENVPSELLRPQHGDTCRHGPTGVVTYKHWNTNEKFECKRGFQWVEDTVEMREQIYEDHEVRKKHRSAPPSVNRRRRLPNVSAHHLNKNQSLSR